MYEEIYIDVFHCRYGPIIRVVYKKTRLQGQAYNYFSMKPRQLVSCQLVSALTLFPQTTHSYLLFPELLLP